MFKGFKKKVNLPFRIAYHIPNMKKIISYMKYIMIKLVKTNDKNKNLKSSHKKEYKLHVNRNKDNNNRRFWKYK